MDVLLGMPDPSPGPPVEALVDATMAWRAAVEQSRIEAGSAALWNECATAAGAAQELLCRAVAPEQDDLGHILRASHAGREELSKVVELLLQRSTP